MNNAARKVAYWLVLSLPFTTALVFSSAFSASFTAPKNAILVFTTFALAALALTISSQWKPPKEEWWFWIATAAYPGFTIISAIRSQGPYISFESLCLPVCGVLLFAASREALSGEGSIVNTRNLQIAISLAAVLVSLVAVAQFFGMNVPGAFRPYFNFPNRMRMAGTLGNPDFVAALLAVAVPAAIGLARTAGRSSALWVWAWSSSSVLIGVAILLTGSRGGVIACATGVTVVAFTLIRKRGPILIAVAIACALAAGTQLNSRTPWESLRGRIFIWQVALGEDAARSAFGSGPGSFSYEYSIQLGRFFAQPGRQPLLHFASHELHAQNDFVETLHDSGWLGVGSLLVLLGSWFRLAIRRLRRSDDAAKPAIAAAIASVSALCAASLFDFPMRRAETSALLWLSMAVPLVSPTLPAACLHRWAWLRYAGAALILVAGSYSAFKPLAASYEVAKGESEEDQERPESSLTTYRSALRWEPSSPDANFDLVRALAKAGDYSGALAQSRIAARYVNEPELYILRSRILQNADRKSEARGELEEAVRLFPYSMEVRGEIASLPLPARAAQSR